MILLRRRTSDLNLTSGVETGSPRDANAIRPGD